MVGLESNRTAYDETRRKDYEMFVEKIGAEIAVKKEIIEKCSTYEELILREVYWIDFYDATNKKIGYNILKYDHEWPEGMRKTLSRSKRKSSYKPSKEMNEITSKNSYERYHSGNVSAEFLNSQGKISERGEKVWGKYTCSRCHKTVKGKANYLRYHERNCGTYLEKTKVKCPFCNKEGAKSAMVLWHFNKCKNNPNKQK